MEDHPILQFSDNTRAPPPHSSVKNRGDKISRIDASDCDNNEGNTRSPEVSSLQQNGSRTKDRNVEQQLMERERTSHCMASTSSGEVYTRRKSEYQLRMSLLTTSARTRRRSSGEIGRNCDKGRRNLADTIPVRISDRAFAMHGLLAEEVNVTKTATADQDQEARTGEAPGSCQATTPTNASENVRSLFIRPPISHKERVLDRRKRGEVKNYHRERSNETGQHASESHLLHWPFRVSATVLPQNGPNAEFTRIRSASDSDIIDSVLPFEKREQLERLKTQIYEDNFKRENRKAREIGGSFPIRGDKIFPVLEEKSVMRYTKSHATIKPTGSRNGVTSETRLDTRGGDVRDLYPPKENQNSAVHVGGYDIESTDNSNESIRDLELLDISSNDKESEPYPTLPPQQAYLEHYRPQEELKRPQVHVASKNELVDLQSIRVIIDRLQNAHRARSEPGDVGSRKPSTVHLLNRARSETDNIKIKVQKFVTKPLPALPPSTLRVNKLSSEKGSSKGFSKAGAYANTSERPRENIHEVINIHTCPSLNLFSSRSWMYQGKEQKKHRYIRGPATPIPPVDFVFSKKDSDTASG